MTDARVSIVIPVWNGDLYLSAAIESALAQTHPEVEVVVVDDGSADASATIAGGFDDVTLVQQANQGAGPARNAGVAASTGTHLSFLDADDVMLPEKTATQLEALARNPEVDVVYGHVEEFWSEDLAPDERPSVRISESPMPIHAITSGLLRRETFERVGPFSDDSAGQTIDWYLRSRELGLRELMLDDIAYRRRVHRHNQGISHPETRTTRLAVLKASLDRRRGQDPPLKE